jgi:hypothetical protein
MIEYLPKRISYQVTVDGFAVPNIEARETDNGTQCHIALDGRFGAVIPAEHAQEVIWLLANALAIGAGYSCHGENSVKANPFKVRVSEIDSAIRSQP